MTTHHAPSPEPSASLPAPLPVPERARALDLGQSFTQLLFRASMLTRKREEEAQAARAAQQELLGALVEVDDALASLGLDPELVHLGRGAGIEATRRRLLGRLAKAGVRPMRLEGLTADPVLAEIVGTEPRRGVAPETVVQTVVTGFFWGDEVLRRAQVVVAAPEPEPVPVPVQESAPEPEEESVYELGAGYVEAVLAPEAKPEGGVEAEGTGDAAVEPVDAAEPVEPAPGPAAGRPKTPPTRPRRARTGSGTRRKRKKN
ncbi:nucleotide exchange factor GrpE [Streptomyces sp. SP17BM10]|uniref:nucleotide exchange factor GrpE n=1 Tax=Streptomyces sp. SP17BM10 TaxID=3002530 RepID=UPI002E79D5F6|nr:nucleotide exchange factor GrpE [Streptomyces sp. SP17BM10]MEE1782065.1 nucleotide exchange factor GrpE [Streptomyces sp. SP17BM10]